MFIRGMRRMDTHDYYPEKIQEAGGYIACLSRRQALSAGVWIEHKFVIDGIVIMVADPNFSIRKIW